MARVRIYILLFGAVMAVFCAACSDPPGAKISDPDLRIWSNSISPNGRSRIVIYQRDIGALGYSRVFWAVTAAEPADADLAKFRLPDGYRAEGWSDAGELKVSKWQPSYGIHDSREIRDGDSFAGVKVKMVENNSTYELPGYEEPKNTQ